MDYIFLFLAGIAAFISPCLLPMLPLYISYFAAGRNDRRKTMKNALGFVCGFIMIFIILGAFSGFLGGFLRDYSLIINIVCGLIIIFFGLIITGLIKIPFFINTGSKDIDVKNLNFFTSFLFGIIFSLGSSACLSAWHGYALAVAARQGGLVKGMLMLFVYSLGLALPIVLSVLILDRLKTAFEVIKRNYKKINLISGIILIIIGILMAAGFFRFTGGAL